MQYILRGAWRPYELSERCEEIRLTPIKSKIEVDLRMHVEDDSHNQDVLKPSKLQKQTLSSSVVSFSSPHAVGVLMQNQIHLNPVYAILQLHPSLSDLNDDIPKKELVPKPADANIKHMKDKIALKNSDQSAVNEEASVSLVYHASSSSASRKYKRSMTAEGQNQIEFGLKPSGYLHFLSSGGRGMADRKDSTLSMQLLLGLPLEERLQKWFCQVKQINRFVALKHLAYGYSEVDLLRVLHSYANLVQGLWVCKSSLLYDGDEAMQRDYILLLFSRRKTICYHQLKCIKLDHHLFKCMMNALAYERKTLGNWKFKESTDYSFIKCYPNIAKEQEKSWFDREKLILDFVRKLGKKIPQIARASLTSKRVKAKTAHKADSFTCMAKGTIDVSAGQTMTDETREHLPKALLEIFNDQKVRRLGLVFLVCKYSDF
ncbi:hypothetical protein HPP92_026151 [Vanilla planifolia]|uniref:DNA-directed RNA polymerase III subunit RPC5 n=1 Tax=Vanilla planifolia TaxID=51239 RepID=A0A835PHR7_VANPL|nr:hypothetical protein HPP92_026151 [Vanilla planifolia]